jgi:uncharacterized protein (DUF2147 family)
MFRTPFACALLLLALPLGASAQGAPIASTPVGRWKTIDDKTGQPKSIVEIYATGNGTLAGKVVQLIDTAKGPNPRCDRCSGERHNQPVLGMVIAWGLKPGNAGWDGGRILDPDNGKIYSARMTPIAGGQQLEVRGYLGTPLLGRSQTWIRAR